ncbi:PepSY-like domain-containing protein [Niabella sp. CJ426]|uniref:PepSY-like domain-containing protein n=1 Tax=Niabella sp. CJ426 TaxID=3393740 RepID=UPI003CFF6D9D
MRKVIFVLLALVNVLLANAQKVSDKVVPVAVKSSLQEKYPNAKVLKWERENGNYEAGFEVATTGYSVLMDASGKILETETEIKKDELPANAKAHVAKYYAGQKIKATAKNHR